MSELCFNNKNIPLRFTVLNYLHQGEHTLYGTALTTFKEIERLEPKIIKLKNVKGVSGGFIKFNQFKMDVRPSLVEYLRYGWQLDVSIAVDFSLSNLEINDHNSLHKLSDNEMNYYEKAIKEVCNIMRPYAKNKFKAYGFSGIPAYMGMTRTSRLWNLNGMDRPECQDTQGVLNAY